MKLIDADARVTVQSFDPMNEEYNHDEMTVEQALNFATDEGCPPIIDAVPVVHGRWIDGEGNSVSWCGALQSSPADSCWCDQCGTWLVASDEYPVYGLFCPACGAKMDGERRDEDGTN